MHAFVQGKSTLKHIHSAMTEVFHKHELGKGNASAGSLMQNAMYRSCYKALERVVNEKLGT